MAQTPAQIVDRFKYTGTKGGYQERSARAVLNKLIEAAILMEALHSDAIAGGDKTSMHAAFDTAVTAVHSGVSKLDDNSHK